MPILDHLTGEARCRAALANLGLDWPILRPGVPMPTVPAAARAIGVDPGLIAKTLVFVDPAGKIIVAVASGLTRIDRQRLADIVGVPRLKLANPDTVLAATGYPAGGVSPIGHQGEHPFVVDRALSDLTTVYAGGGEHDLLLQIDVERLFALLTPTLADISAKETLETL